MPDATQQEREAYAAFVEQYTGRDMAYHERYGTTGIDFGLAAFLAGRASLSNSGRLVEALTTIAQMDPDGVRADDLGRAAGIARAALSAKEPK